MSQHEWFVHVLPASLAVDWSWWQNETENVGNVRAVAAHQGLRRFLGGGKCDFGGVGVIRGSEGLRFKKVTQADKATATFPGSEQGQTGPTF